MHEKYEVSIDVNSFVCAEYKNDQLKQQFLDLLAASSYTRPNSMHRTGRIIDSSAPPLLALLADLNTKFSLALDGKVYQVYAFTAQYEDGSNNYLDMHADNSIITINWNLSLSSDLDGTDLLIPGLDKVVKPKENQLLIHHGKQRHQVTERKKGSRCNLIIWLK